MDDMEPIELPIDGTLDLHAFRPGEVKHLVPDYLEECRARGILHVRIVHGKGTGALRRTVHSLLDEARELPLPSTFMLQVRTLAVAHGLIEPMAPEDPPAADPPA